MRLSFVIPAYNEEGYLGTCLESVTKAIGDRWNDFEIIVVNNASSDNTAEIASYFDHVTVIDEPRKGLSQARQTGFKACTGELIANVDADCLVPDEWLNTVLKKFESNPAMVALSGPHVFYDFPPLINRGIDMYYRFGFIGYLINRYVLRKGSLIQGGNFVIRKSSLEAIGGFNPAFTFYGEDADIAKRLSKVGDVVFTFQLPMHTSARRLKTEGVLTMMIRYPINLLWTNLFGKPFTKTYRDIRERKNTK